MMMQQQSGMGMQNRPMDGDPSQRFMSNMMPNGVGMDPAASAAAAAAYGHLGFNGSASAPASRRQSQKNNDGSQVGQPDGSWNGMNNAMSEYLQNNGDVNNIMSMRPPPNSDFRANINGYEADGPSSNSSEESAQGKRRRMTFGVHPSTRPMFKAATSLSSCTTTAVVA